MGKVDMFDFLSWQDLYYRSPGKEFNTTHVFTITKSEPTKLVKQDQHGAIKRIDNLLPKSNNP